VRFLQVVLKPQAGVSTANPLHFSCQSRRKNRGIAGTGNCAAKNGLDTHNLTAEQARLGASVRDAERQYESLRQDELVRPANQQKRSRLRRQIFDMLALRRCYRIHWRCCEI
jgi:hypothetical protein